MKEYSTDAWENFKNDKWYQRLCDELIDSGINQPFCDNILRIAFNAGYYSKYSPKYNYIIPKDINHPWL